MMATSNDHRKVTKRSSNAYATCMVPRECIVDNYGQLLAVQETEDQMLGTAAMLQLRQTKPYLHFR
jgi:hypothetical protein